MSFFRSLLSRFMGPFRFLLSPLFRLLRGARGVKIAGPSLPAVVAWLLFLLLVTAWIVHGYVSSKRGQFTGVWDYLVTWYSLARLAGVIFLPVLTYSWLRRFLEGDISEYQDLDEAFAAGLEALNGQRLGLKDLPLYLILGPSNKGKADDLLGAASLEYLVQSIPEARTAPLHWYATEQGVFLVCSGAGQLSAVNNLLDRRPLAPLGPVGQQPVDVRSTLVVNDPADASSGGVQTQPVAYGGNPSRGQIYTTLDPDATPAATTAAPTSARNATIAEMEEQDLRLGHVCRLLRRARRPVCPLNGVLTELPLAHLESDNASSALCDAVRSDLNTIRKISQMVAPTTAIITGLEQEDGFCELVRRLGHDLVSRRRFGKGYKLWAIPTDEDMDALSAHACGAFEQWTYKLFSEADSLSRTGNAYLYALLCKIRGKVQPNLQKVLVSGYSNASDSAQPPLLSGCYFGGLGPDEGRLAFIPGVFEKMLEQEEYMEWGQEALDADDRCYLAARILLGANLILSVLLGLGLVWYVFFRDQPPPA